MKTVSIALTLQLLVVSLSQADYNEPLSHKGIQKTMVELNSLGQHANKLAVALMLDPDVKKDVTVPEVRAALSAGYSEMHLVSTHFIFFEKSASAAMLLQDSTVKQKILLTVVTQYLIFSIKLENRESGNRAIMDLHNSDLSMKRRLQEQNQLSTKLRDLCFQRIKAMMQIDGLKSGFNDAALNCMKEHGLIE